MVAVNERVTFYPKDGSKELRARVTAQAPYGWWDLMVDNKSVEDGTPHRNFEVRSRPVLPSDTDKRGLFAPDKYLTPAMS